MTDRLHREPTHDWVAGRIPSLLWRDPSGELQAAVIFMSGGGGRKEDVPAWVVDRVTTSGIALLSMDLPFHGERAPAELPSAQPTVKDFIELVEQTVEDLHTVATYLRVQRWIDESRIGVAGFSLSASCALAAVASGLEARALLSICGAADYAGATAFRMQREGSSPEEIEKAVRELESLPATLDPLRNVAAFSRCSLMMVHGQHDQSVPLDRHRALYEAVAPYFIDHPQDCLFLTHAGKHGIRRPILEIAWSWLIDQLLTGASRGAGNGD